MMHPSDAKGWLSGHRTGLNEILDAMIATGRKEEHAAIPPEALVMAAQYDAAMTARACAMASYHEQRAARAQEAGTHEHEHGDPRVLRRFGIVAATADRTLVEHWQGVAERLEGELDDARRACRVVRSSLEEARADAQRLEHERDVAREGYSELERLLRGMTRERDVWSERAETHEQERDQALSERDEARALYEGADAQRLIAHGALHRAKAILAGCEEARLMGERALADAQVQLESPPMVQLKDRLRIVIGETKDGRVEPGDLAYVDTLVDVKGFEQNIEAGWMRIDVQPVVEGARI